MLPPKERSNFCSWLSVCGLGDKLYVLSVLYLCALISFGLLILLLNKRQNKALVAHLKCYNIVVMNGVFLHEIVRLKIHGSGK